jgi:hypothetical protein
MSQIPQKSFWDKTKDIAADILSIILLILTLLRLFWWPFAD